MKPRATAERLCGSSGSCKALRLPSKREKWVCIPDPWTAAKGFGMKVAWALDSWASSLTTWRTVMTEIDLVLAGGILVLAVLDRDAHVLQRQHGGLPQVGSLVGHGELEVRPV